MSNNILPIYTIGYGNRSITHIIELLNKYQISQLVDVRSFPYSKYNSDFNRENLQNSLQNQNIVYTFVGDLLGGRPNDRTCYNNEGQADYSIISQKDFYINGIKLLKEISKYKNTCIMCSEIKPETCHRSKLIGETLFRDGMDILHIDSDNGGTLVKHTTVIGRLGLSLFDLGFTSLNKII